MSKLGVVDWCCCFDAFYLQFWLHQCIGSASGTRRLSSFPWCLIEAFYEVLCPVDRGSGLGSTREIRLSCIMFLSSGNLLG